MEKNSIGSGVHLLYKLLGETPHEAILRFKNDNPLYTDESMTYAGRLDPMAEGLLLVLSGDNINQKEKYLDLPKTYEFEVLWGFETDTLDVLGLVVKSIKLKVESKSKIQEELEKLVGKFEQEYPAYSSKPVDGKPLFQWAREGRLNEIEIPKHQVEVLNAEFILRKVVSGEKLLSDIVSKVVLVRGDFRQIEILDKWREIFLKLSSEEFMIDKISVTASSGFYVRQFVSDIAKSFRTSGVTFHIKRTKIGEYLCPEN